MRIHVRAWGSALIVSGLAAGILTGSTASAVAVAEPVADGQLPFVAKVTFGEERDQRSCTGVLVDSRWIATHKSCFTDGSAPVAAGAPAKPTTVLVGRTDLTKTTGHRVAVQSVVPHPDRNIVLAELSAAVEGITPVKLGAAAQAGETLRIAGYGRTGTEWVPDRLHAATFTVQSAGTSSFEVTGANSLCKGDAGGPALRETAGGAELVGISDTSWQKGCLGESEARDGAIEARADDLADWIRVTATEQPQGLRDPVTGEFTRDGIQDLIAADPTTGKLWLYPGTANRNAWGHRVEIGVGWAGYREFAIGRINRDQYDDLITIETASQKLWLYPGTATGGRFGARIEYGSGWGPFRDIAIGRVNADAYDDLLTVRDTDGKLYLYKGNAGGVRFDAGVEYGSGWQCCAQVTLGRFNTDEYDDLLTVDKATGKLRLYAGRADGTQFVPSVDPGAGATWGNATYIARGKFDGTGFDGLLKVDTSGVTTLTPRTSTGGWGAAVPPVGRVVNPTPADLTKLAVGELNRDAYQDLIGADPAGLLWLYPGTAAHTWGPRVQVGSGWNNGRELVIARANRDNYDDLVSIETSTAKQWLYPGTATGTLFGARQQIGSGWTDFRDVTIGRVNRDDWDDLLVVKDGDNKLYLYKGNSAGGHFDAGVAYGSGWQCCTQLTLGSFNADDYDDLLTVDKATGKLRLYASKEDGTQFVPSIDPGAGEGWANRTELLALRFAAGQHDGLLAKDPSGDLLLFPTTEKGNPDWADPIHFGSRD